MYMYIKSQKLLVLSMMLVAFQNIAFDVKLDKTIRISIIIVVIIIVSTWERLLQPMQLFLISAMGSLHRNVDSMCCALVGAIPCA